MRWLRANLLRVLKRYAEEARRSYDKTSAARIDAIVDCVENMSMSDSGRSEEVYELMGVQVPQSLDSASWDYRQRGRIGEIAQKEPWM